MSGVKRFRPSTESVCSQRNCVESPCSIPCAHCSLTYCLRHLVEHQILIDAELKRTRAAIETSRRQLRLIQFVDDRSALFEQLDRWVIEVKQTAERMTIEIEKTFEESQEKFNAMKESILNEQSDDQQMLAELERTVCALQSARMSLILPSMIDSVHVVKPAFHSSLYTPTRPIESSDLIRRVSTSELVFTLDYDPTDTTHYTTSSNHLVLYRSSRSVFQFFNRSGEHLFDIHYDHHSNGDLNQMIWSNHLNNFLLATSKQLLKLNTSTKRVTRYVDIGFGFYKDVCANGESIVLVHHLGTSLGDVIEHYSNHQLTQRCWKNDLYPNEKTMKETMEIFRIRLSANLLAIDALFTDKLLICDVLQAMKCLFAINTKECNISAISSIYDTKQWFVFAEDESSFQRAFLLDAHRNDDQEKQMQPISFPGLSPINVTFFGSDQIMVTRRNLKDDENLLFECRKMHSIF